MLLDALQTATLQSTILFLAVWLVFHFARSLPANSKAWIWRLAFVKPLAALVPFAAITLRVLPAAPITESAGSVSVRVSSVSDASIVIVPTGINWLFVLWVVGASAVALYGIVGRLKLESTHRRSSPFEDISTSNHLSELCQQTNLRRKPRLLSSDQVDVPMVIGGLRPTIILPAEALCEQTELRMMLAHEVAHLARRDLAWFCLVWVTQVLFFFNPVVWVAARSARLDHESATDRHAVELAGVTVKTYAAMLMRATVAARPSLAQQDLQMGVLRMSDTFRSIHRRLEAMQHFQSQPSRWRTAAIGTLAIALIGLLPTYNLAQAPAKPSKPAAHQVKSAKKAAITKGHKPSALAHAKSAKSAHKPHAPTPAKHGQHPSAAPKADPLAPAGVPGSAPQANPFARPGGSPSPAPKSDPFSPAGVPGSAPHANPFARPGAAPSPAPNAKPPSGLGISAPTPEPKSKPADPAAPHPSGHPSTPAKHDPTKADDLKIDISLHDADVRTAFRTLFHQVKARYVVESEVNGTVTLELSNTPLDVCVQMIAKAVGATCKLENGIYVIQAQKPVN